MKTSRRDVRKPEMALYRPGMGLQNKNNKSEDKFENKIPKSSSPTDYAILDQLKSMDLNNEDQTSNQEMSKSSKNTKNRRPDIQVYMPKPKIAAQLNNKKPDDKNGSQLASKNDAKSKEKKSPEPHLKESFNGEGKSSKKNSKSSNKTVSSKQISSNSPVPANSPVNVDDSDVSISRSSPEKICNGDGDNRHRKDIDGRHKQKHKTKNKNNVDRKQVTNHNTKKNDYPSSSNLRNAELFKEKLDHNDFVPNDKVGAKQKSSEISAKNTEERVENFLKEERRDSVQSRNGKKRIEQKTELPPRFQKNKKLSQENHLNGPSKYNSSSVGTGGILKLPVDFNQSVNSPEPIESTMYVPKLYQERPVFIHKTLFDPNNPNKPEIVNIPAPHPPPHLPYSNVSNEYYSSEPAYISPPMHNLGYIPPPQPPVMNRQFFGIPDVKMNIIPDNYLNRREFIPPPVPNPAYCPQTITYAEMPPVQPEPVKKR